MFNLFKPSYTTVDKILELLISIDSNSTRDKLRAIHIAFPHLLSFIVN